MLYSDDPEEMFKVRESLALQIHYHVFMLTLGFLVIGFYVEFLCLRVSGLLHSFPLTSILV